MRSYACGVQVALCSAVAAPPGSLGAATAVALLCAHNCCLSVWPGWEAWVVSDDRDYTSLLDMNKEGILSLPSYWAVYLLGQVAGRALLVTPDLGFLPPAASAAGLQEKRTGSRGKSKSRSRSPSTTRSSSRRTRQDGSLSSQQVIAAWHDRSRQLAASVVLLWLCTLLSVFEPPYGLGLQPSRRLLNGSYTCWLLAQCGTWLLSYLLLELNAPPVPQELEQRGLDMVLAISGQLLPTFLVANIATVRNRTRSALLCFC